MFKDSPIASSVYVPRRNRRFSCKKRCSWSMIFSDTCPHWNNSGTNDGFPVLKQNYFKLNEGNQWLIVVHMITIFKIWQYSLQHCHLFPKWDSFVCCLRSNMMENSETLILMLIGTYITLGVLSLESKCWSAESWSLPVVCY